jgi:hypothetical protein
VPTATLASLVRSRAGGSAGGKAAAIRNQVEAQLIAAFHGVHLTDGRVDFAHHDFEV